MIISFSSSVPHSNGTNPQKKCKKTLKLLLCNSEVPAHQKYLSMQCAELQQLNSLKAYCRNNKFEKQEKKGDFCQPKSIHELMIGCFLIFLNHQSAWNFVFQKKSLFFLILCINLHQLECTVSFCKAHVTKFAFMSCSTGFVSFLLLQYTAPWIVTLETFHLTELALNVLLPFHFQAAVK